MAFYAGWAESNPSVKEVTDEAIDWLTGRIEQEITFADGLFGDLRDLRKDTEKDEAFKDAWITDRAEGYTNTLDSVFDHAKILGAENLLLTFTGIDGEVSCGTCQGLKGKTATARWWVENDLIPGPGNLNYICNGYNCLHGLEDSEGNIFTAEKAEELRRIIAWEGGPGSGNFGHSGRPGQQGGSGDGEGSLTDSAQQAREAIEDITGIKPAVKEVVIMGDTDFNEFARSFQAVGTENVAGVNIDGVITIRDGFQDSLLHEYVHSSGFMPDNINPVVNEGMTQAFTKDLAEKYEIEARSGYTREVDWVDKYIIPLTGLRREELFKGYASSNDKQTYLDGLIWERYGDRFSDTNEWGQNVKDRFMTHACDYVGYDIYLNYLVDELGIHELQIRDVDLLKVLEFENSQNF
jgi:hypothetical protein